MLSHNDPPKQFVTGQALLGLIKEQTTHSARKFEQRDFVEPLLRFCSDGDYSARIGIVFGLRSTGKTVGMLQVAEALINQGHKVAYARYNYKTTGMNDANAEILNLAKEGYAYFIIDEAPYLSGFLNESAEWADTFVPCNRIKIVISGTDSFELWLAMGRALYHRYVRFSTNRNSFPEFKRVLGQSFEDYKVMGGVFISSSDTGATEYGTESLKSNKQAIEHFIQSAVVKNLVNTLEHCNESYGAKNYYYDWLYAIDEPIIFKGVISILESTVYPAIRKNFIQDAAHKNIPVLGDAISKWPDTEKRDVRERIAESLSVYQGFKKIEQPGGTVDALTEFLIKIGCLAESSTGVSDLFENRRTLYFAHNALMNYAIGVTTQGILTLTGINHGEFTEALKQAAEGAMNENIVYFHLMLSLKENEKLFRYRDAENREIDAVIINRKAKELCLIEVKSKAKIDSNRIASNEARHLLDDGILKNIGIDDSFSITRVVVYRGSTSFALCGDNILLLVNIEDLLVQCRNLSNYLNNIRADAEKTLKE